MLVLALDSTGDTCSAALIAGDGRAVATASLGGGGASRQMLVLAGSVLRDAGLPADQIERVAVAVGPGSFTGLRVAIATANGLGRALGRPVIGVSSLAALATVVMDDGRPFTVVLDAFRGEVYVARFCFKGRALERLSPDQVCTPMVAARTLLQAGERALGSGTMRHRELLTVEAPDAVLEDGPGALAVGVGRLALLNLASSATVVQPCYLRAVGAGSNAGG